MATKEILFATYKDEAVEDGLSYAIYLAGLLGAGLRIVLLDRLGLGEKFDRIMSAITFAEANEHETARSILSGNGNGGENGKDTASLYSYLLDRCETEGVKANIHTGYSDNVGSIKDFLKHQKIEMVVLSPAATRSNGILKRLTKISHTPVVTMAR